MPLAKTIPDNPQFGTLTDALREHYRKTFHSYGLTARGVDWGECPDDALLRYHKMLAVMDGALPDASVLDVGCGYGALADVIDQFDIPITYTGIDVVEEMIEAARTRHPQRTFLCGDILSQMDLGVFDYVVCNGILTQKLGVSTLDMNRHCQHLLTTMFGLAKRGVAVNVMSTFANYYAPNLYYRNPSELLAWCMSQLTRHVRLDHAYPLFEYTLYLYQHPTQNTSLSRGVI